MVTPANDSGRIVAPPAGISCFFLLIKVIGTQLSITLKLIHMFQYGSKYLPMRFYFILIASWRREQ